MAIDVGVVGAAGYAGAELVRILSAHPQFNIAHITSDSDAGSRLDALYPSFTGVSDLVFESHDAADLAACDAVFLAVPHTAAMARVPALLDAGVSVFDLSADFRLKDAEVYEQWYGTSHTAPQLLPRAAFGLPEITGAELQQAKDDLASGTPALVACAGCYPTATSLAAWPAVSAGWLDGVLDVQAISGVTGAGKKASARTHYCNANENAEPYGVGTHRHTPEIEQILGIPRRVLFVPHLAPLNRGLLSTVTVRLTDEAAATLDAQAVQRRYESAYAHDPFVHVLAAGSMPRTASVAGGNHAQIGVAFQPTTKTIVACCAIDNLCKGAAGQAVQCANIVFGFDECAGLGMVAQPV